MTRYRTLISTLLLASSLGVMALPAAAAQRDCAPRGMYGAYWDQGAERMERHHKRVHDALKLTAEQEGAWKKLVDSEHPMMAKGKPGMAEDWSKLTTPERAEKMLEFMKERQTQMTDHVAVLKEFYATLSPEQKKTFDQLHADSKGGMRGKRGARRPRMDQPMPMQKP